MREVIRVIEHGAYWAPDATVTLLRVPWDSSYADVVDWVDVQKRDAWFSSAENGGLKPVNPTAYHRTGTVLRIDVPYRDCYTYNYVHVHNGSMPTSQTGARDFFYFITGFDMTNPAVTTLNLDLDVWTTYWPTATVDTGFLVRGHIAQVNRPALDDDNIPAALSTYYEAPEGLDTGNEFRPYLEVPFSLQQETEGSDEERDWVIVISTARLTADFGTVESPKLKTGTGGVFQGIISGAGVYAIHAVDFQRFMGYLGERPWISQCIVSITTVPSSLVGDINPYVEGTLGGTSLSGVTMYRLNMRTPGEIDINSSIDFSNISGSGWDAATQPYADLRKLWQYPYTAVQLTNHSGNALNLKPQLLPGNVTALVAMGIAIQPFTRACVFPKGYGMQSGDSFTVRYENADWNGSDAYGSSQETWHTLTIPYGDFTQTALWFSDFPQWSIVNNSYLTYMASNANTIAYNYNRPEWQADVARYSNGIQRGLTYANANEQEALAQEQFGKLWGWNQNYNRGGNTPGLMGNYADIGMNRATNDVALGILGGVGNAVNSAAGGAGPASVLGNAALGLAQTGLSGVFNVGYSQQGYDADRSIAQLNLVQQLKAIEDPGTGRKAVADTLLDQQNTVADMNKDIAIQGVQAGVRDAALLPPSVVGQAGGNGFRYANGLMFSGVIKYMRVSDDAIIRAGQYFRRFGYAVNRYVRIPRSLNVCKHFSYWKFLDLQLASAYADETAKGRLRGIMYTGTTVWGDPAEIGHVMVADNAPDHTKDGDYYG